MCRAKNPSAYRKDEMTDDLTHVIVTFPLRALIGQSSECGKFARAQATGSVMLINRYSRHRNAFLFYNSFSSRRL